MNSKLKNPLKNKKKPGFPQTTTRKPSKGKGPKVKQTQFTSEGQPPSLNEKGIAMEKENVKVKNIILAILGILGVVLCFFDIRDKGMMLEIVGAVKYSGSLVGVILTTISVIGIWNNKPHVSIKS